jgi:hypothetical protein
VNIATVATSEGKTDRNALGEDRRPSKEVWGASGSDRNAVQSQCHGGRPPPPPPKQRQWIVSNLSGRRLCASSRNIRGRRARVGTRSFRLTVGQEEACSQVRRKLTTVTRSDQKCVQCCNCGLCGHTRLNCRRGSNSGQQQADQLCPHHWG